MATDSMEVNFREIHAVAGQGEGEVNWLQECANIGNFDQELDLGGPKMAVFDQDHASKKVQKFYFVKFWPYQDPEEKSKIEQAQKFIQKMDQERIPLLKSYRTKWSQLDHAYSQLSRLRHRKSNLDYTMNWKQSILDYLEEALDKLNFQKNSYKKSSSSPADPNFHIIQGFRVLHESSKNLATERKLLKEISRTRNQSQAADDIHHDSSYLMKGLNDFIRWIYERKQGETRYKNFLKEFKHLEEKMEKTIAAASQKGRIWDPWTSSTNIQEHITLSEEMEKEEGEIIAETERVEKDKETETIRKEAFMLGDQLKDIHRRKYEAEKCILNLRKWHEEANVSYNEYLSILKKARELARKKDVAALEELSCKEVDKFMRRWNNSEVFRNSYVKRMWPSLTNRRLSHDGRMKNHDEEPSF